MGPLPRPVENLENTSSVDIDAVEDLLENISITTGTESINDLEIEIKHYQEDKDILKLIPDYEQLIVQADIYFQNVIQDLVHVIQTKNLYTGLTRSISQLKWYIEMFGLRFTKDQHIHLVQLFLELLTMDTCPERIIPSLCDVIVLLLRKHTLLSTKDVVIPWQPLYNLFYQYSYRTTTGSTSLTSTVEKLKLAIRGCNRYFGENALEEVIEKISQKLFPDNNEMSIGLDLLNYFLPLYEPSNFSALSKFIARLLCIWDIWCVRPNWEVNMLNLCITIATGFPSFDWTPYLGVMHSRFRQIWNDHLNKSDDEKIVFINQLSLWIISTFGNNKSALEHYKVTLLFYNKSVFENFPPVLPHFVQQLVKRIKRERYVCKTKRIINGIHMTDEDIEFITTTLFEMCIDYHIDSCAGSKIFRDLAYINPKYVFPRILEKYYLSLDRVEEPGRYIVSLDWVHQILSAFICWEENYLNEKGSSIIELAYTLLPAIGPNDLQITTMAMDSFGILFQRIPMIDCSSLSTTKVENHWKRFYLSTSGFMNLCCQFLHKIFMLIEFSKYDDTSVIDNMDHLPEGDSDDEKLETTLWNTFHPLAMNASVEICEALSKKIVKFAFTRVLETQFAGKLFTSILEAFVMARPEILLPQLLPPLTKSLKVLIDEQSGDCLTPELNFRLLVLSKVVHCSGYDLIQYKEYFNELIQLILTLEIKIALPKICETLTKLLYSLCSVYPLEIAILQKMENGKLPFPKDWINKRNIKYDNIDLEWHIPNSNELYWAEEIFLKIFTKYYNFIQEQISHPDLNTPPSSNVSKQRLLNALAILNSAFEGISCALSMESDLGVGKVLKIPKYRFSHMDWTQSTLIRKGEILRRHYFKLLCSFQNYLILFRSDETEMYEKLIHCYMSLLDHSGDVKLYSYNKGSFLGLPGRNNPLCPSWLCFRPEFAIKAYSLYRNMSRILEDRYYLFTSFHEDIYEKLLELCTNRYFGVRIIAQICIKYLLFLHSNAMNKSTIPKLMKYIHMEATIHEVKGGLCTIEEIKAQMIHENTWENIFSVWMGVLNAPFSEKDSVTSIQDSIISEIDFYFSYFPSQEEIQIPSNLLDECNNLCNSLHSNIPQLALETNKSSNNKIWFDRLIEGLLHTGTSTNSWYVKSRVSKLLAKLITKRVPMTIPMIQFYYTIILSDSMKLRTYGMNTLYRLFRLFKRKADCRTVNTDDFLKKNEFESYYEFILYKSEHLSIKTKCQNLYIHPTCLGSFSIPKKLNFKNEIENFTLENESTQIQVFCHQSQLYFSNPIFVKEFLILHSLDSIDDLRIQIMFYFKSFARSNGPKSLSVIMEEMKKILEVEKENKDKGKQLLIHCIMNGILMGLKYWTDEIIFIFWNNSLKPILEICWEILTEETEQSWISMGINIMNNCDCRKYNFFMEFLYNKLKSNINSSSMTSVKPYIDIGTFVYAIYSINWRGVLFHNEIFEEILEFVINHPSPFQNVRYMIASVLANIVLTREKIKKSKNYSLTAVLMKSTNRIPDIKDLINSFKEKFANLYLDCTSNEKLKDETQQLLLSFKTVITWIMLLSDFTQPSIFQFLPLICQFINYTVDQEIEEICDHILTTLSSNEIPNDCLNSILTSSYEICKMESWRSRFALTRFLGGVMYYNIHLIKDDLRSDEFSALILKLVYDVNFDVRQLASGYLSYLIQFSILKQPLTLLVKFKDECLNLKQNKDLRKIENSKNEINFWHSAISGLTAFVYSNQGKERMPNYLPGLLVFLVNQMMDNSPFQIRTEVQNSLQYFRKYYQDNWIEHKNKFTEDQINILSNAIVSSDYHV